MKLKEKLQNRGYQRRETEDPPLNAAHGLDTELHGGKNSAKSPFAKFLKDIFTFARSQYSLHCFCHFRIVDPVFVMASKKWSWSKARNASKAVARSEGSIGDDSSRWLMMLWRIDKEKPDSAIPVLDRTGHH
jgi:hypothetical protein